MRLLIFVFGAIALSLFNGFVITQNFGLTVGLLWAIPSGFVYGWHGFNWVFQESNSQKNP